MLVAVLDVIWNLQFALIGPPRFGGDDGTWQTVLGSPRRDLNTQSLSSGGVAETGEISGFIRRYYAGAFKFGWFGQATVSQLLNTRSIESSGPDVL